MQITCEVPSDNDGDYRVAGMSRKEHKNFWVKERNFNYHWYWIASCNNFSLGLMFSVALFMVPFDVSIYIYVPVQTFNMFHCVYALFYFLHSVYTTNIFILQIIHFLSLKFKCIGRRLARLDGSDNKKVDRRLTGLILDFNRVQLELIEVNDFFKNFVGVNTIFFFIISVQCMFLSIFVGWLLRVTLLAAIFAMYLTIILVPFGFADSIPIQVIPLCRFLLSIRLSTIVNGPLTNRLFHFQRSKTKRQLEKLSFNRTVSIWNRQKIETISNLSDSVGFTCFDWFLLDSHRGLLLSFELIIYVLLLITGFYTTGFFKINSGWSKFNRTLLNGRPMATIRLTTWHLAKTKTATL